MKRILARWTDWAGKSLEHLVLAIGAKSIVAESLVIGGEPGFAARYRVECDSRWRVREADVDLLGGTRRISLRGDGKGKWTDANGKRIRSVDGAIDIDLSISPFTNTLPLRRLHLGAGKSADIETVYIRVPEMSIARDPQRYVWLDGGPRIRYESRASDFVREIEFDADGLVVTYPGLFRRVR